MGTKTQQGRRSRPPNLIEHNPSRLRSLLFVGISQTVSLVFAFIIAQGSLEDFIQYFVMFEVIMLYLTLLLWISRKKPSIAKLTPDKVKRYAFITLIIAVPLIASAAWITVFPQLLRYGLEHYGHTANAGVESYQLYRYDGKLTLRTDSTQAADYIHVKLVYAGHRASISVDSHQPAFVQLYQAGQSGYLVPIRYLKAMPAIIRPQAELDYFSHKPITPLVPRTSSYTKYPQLYNYPHPGSTAFPNVYCDTSAVPQCR